MPKKIWINTHKMPCATCLIPVEEILTEGKSRTLRAWQYTCTKCMREIEKRISKLEKKVFIKKT